LSGSFQSTRPRTAAPEYERDFARLARLLAVAGEPVENVVEGKIILTTESVV